jgi:thiol-disulfide isomerase/thioredoxin
MTTPARSFGHGRRRAPGALVLLALATTVLACSRGQGTSSASASTATASSASSPSAPPAAATSPLVVAPRDGVRWMQAPAGLSDVAGEVREAAKKERADGRTLLVYVGATWCEPCQRFHHAVDQGELDAPFPRLSVLAFDLDRDGEALATAGYVSRLIPLFALPGEDGRASGKQIEGSVKGEAAVGEITPRLRALVTGGS